MNTKTAQNVLGTRAKTWVFSERFAAKSAAYCVYGRFRCKHPTKNTVCLRGNRPSIALCCTLSCKVFGEKPVDSEAGQVAGRAPMAGRWGGHRGKDAGKDTEDRMLGRAPRERCWEGHRGQDAGAGHRGKDAGKGTEDRMLGRAPRERCWEGHRGQDAGEERRGKGTDGRALGKGTEGRAPKERCWAGRWERR